MIEDIIYTIDDCQNRSDKGVKNVQENSVMEKMKSVLVTGKDFSAEHALKVLKSDALRLLNDFFVFLPQDLKITANLQKNGGVSLVLSLEAECFRDAGKTLD